MITVLLLPRSKYPSVWCKPTYKLQLCWHCKLGWVFGAPAYAHTHTHTHARTHARTCTHARTHTQVCMSSVRMHLSMACQHGTLISFTFSLSSKQASPQSRISTQNAGAVKSVRRAGTAGHKPEQRLAPPTKVFAAVMVDGQQQPGHSSLQESLPEFCSHKAACTTY